MGLTTTTTSEDDGWSTVNTTADKAVKTDKRRERKALYDRFVANNLPEIRASFETASELKYRRNTPPDTPLGENEKYDTEYLALMKIAVTTAVTKRINCGRSPYNCRSACRWADRCERNSYLYFEEWLEYQDEEDFLDAELVLAEDDAALPEPEPEVILPVTPVKEKRQPKAKPIVKAKPVLNPFDMLDDDESDDEESTPPVTPPRSHSPRACPDAPTKKSAVVMSEADDFNSMISEFASTSAPKSPPNQKAAHRAAKKKNRKR